MKIVVDDCIPYIQGQIEKIADEVVYRPGAEFSEADVIDADALVIRTRTKCNRTLLEGSRVKLIATATIGMDHIDLDYCAEAGITVRNAAGCNVQSVVQYVRSTLYLLTLVKGIDFKGKTFGVIGAGHVGSAVARLAAEEFGFQVLLNDPPRAHNEGEEGFVSLETLLAQSDVISCHTLLTSDGPWPSFHLLDCSAFAQMTKKPILINSSRGEVIETQALKSAIEQGVLSKVILDVWEHEPVIDQALMHQCFLATPHIAGYSADGKVNGTTMSLNAITSFFHLQTPDGGWTIHAPSPSNPIIYASSKMDAALQYYNPFRDHIALTENPSNFEYLRGHYPLRREGIGYKTYFNKL